ncbi:hypothetical protein PSP6_950001 [Paraburkholderia tropica]|nr:hypothetical protein PSP6_950001 [Paraburkholderia tropica]
MCETLDTFAYLARSKRSRRGARSNQAPTLIGCKFLKNNFVSIASFSFAAISEGGELCGSF